MNDFELVLCLKFCDVMCLQLTVPCCCPLCFGHFGVLIQYCIFWKIVLFHFSVVSSFSQVCLLEWGFAFKF